MKHIESSKRVEEAKFTSSILNDLFPHADGSLDKKVLTELGQNYWPVTYKNAKTDDDAEDAFQAYLDNLRDTNNDRWVYLRAMFTLPDIIVGTFGAARWVDQGLPVIRLGHKRAAAMMATSISEELLEYVKAPFKAFFIELPDGLLSLLDVDGSYVKCQGILVHSVHTPEPLTNDSGHLIPAGDYWRYVAVTGTKLVQWAVNRTTKELVGQEDRGNVWVGVGFPLEKYDDRVSGVIGRLICSACLMMSDPTLVKEKQEAYKSKPGQKKADKGAPMYRVFVEGTTTKVDVRAAVASYLRGERESPNVRMLVRGHWKMQPHGPKNSLRRLQWIEPYWAHGAEGDPILQRAHKIGDKVDEGPSVPLQKDEGQ